MIQCDTKRVIATLPASDRSGRSSTDRSYTVGLKPAVLGCGTRSVQYRSNPPNMCCR